MNEVVGPVVGKLSRQNQREAFPPKPKLTVILETVGSASTPFRPIVAKIIFVHLRFVMGMPCQTRDFKRSFESPVTSQKGRKRPGLGGIALSVSLLMVCEHANATHRTSHLSSDAFLPGGKAFVSLPHVRDTHARNSGQWCKGFHQSSPSASFLPSLSPSARSGEVAHFFSHKRHNPAIWQLRCATESQNPPQDYGYSVRLVTVCRSPPPPRCQFCRRCNCDFFHHQYPSLFRAKFSMCIMRVNPHRGLILIPQLTLARLARHQMQRRPSKSGRNFSLHSPQRM